MLRNWGSCAYLTKLSGGVDILLDGLEYVAVLLEERAFDAAAAACELWSVLWSMLRPGGIRPLHDGGSEDGDGEASECCRLSIVIESKVRERRRKRRRRRRT
jgi:hypothetical protein